MAWFGSVYSEGGGGGGLKIVTWADGSPEEIAAMLEAHYAGQIDIHDYWAVGDERKVILGAISQNATDIGANSDVQVISLVLMNEGGMDLTESIGSVSECAFIVGQKNVLGNGKLICRGCTNNSSSWSNTLEWSQSDIRTWANTNYYNALPNEIKNILKQVKVISSSINNTDYVSNDYITFPTEKNVWGTVTQSRTNTTEASLPQFEYYETSTNRIKSIGTSGYYSEQQYSGMVYYITRSIEMQSYRNFGFVASQSNGNLTTPQTPSAGYMSSNNNDASFAPIMAI